MGAGRGLNIGTSVGGGGAVPAGTQNQTYRVDSSGNITTTSSLTNDGSDTTINGKLKIYRVGAPDGFTLESVAFGGADVPQFTTESGQIIKLFTNSAVTDFAGVLNVLVQHGFLAASTVNLPSGILLCSMGNGITVILSSVTYGQFGFGASFGTEVLRQSTINCNCTLKNLYVRTSSTQSATGSMVVTIRKNGVSSVTLLLTIPAGSVAGTFSELVQTAGFSTGDLISIEVANNATATSANILEISCGIYV